MNLKQTAVAIVVLLAAFDVSAATTQRRCSAPEYRQLDFWAGDWDAVDVSKPAEVIARNRVTVILDGCALLEQYDQTDGLRGESFSIYDASRHVWHQSWVTNHGQLLVLEGGKQGDAIVLTGTDARDPAHPLLIRGLWKKVPAGVQETATKSSDGGKTWQPLFDIIFRPHKAPSRH